ncbi:LysM peptidoglycan-binding domain-containing protein [Streptomyces sp. NPDC096339]|uniref:LysM peptidoglycan-binding domain-containing protein n=1 Tax=Streptomyces sp. NPDC096339 TaxID=3366086 RepID=UPI00382B0D59
MGLFDFLKSDKKKHDEAADKAKEQGEQRTVSQAADAASATRAAAERMAAAAPPKPAPPKPAPPKPAAPTPGSAAHKAVPVAPKPAPMPQHPTTAGAVPGAPHTPTPMSAAHKAVPAAPAAKPMPAAKKRMYTVKTGDSLPEIARRELGNEARWRELYAMNRGVIGANPDLIRPGQVLNLPG